MTERAKEYANVYYPMVKDHLHDLNRSIVCLRVLLDGMIDDAKLGCDNDVAEELSSLAETMENFRLDRMDDFRTR